MAVNIAQAGPTARHVLVRAAAAGCIVALSASVARAQAVEMQYRRGPPYAIELPPPQAKGCYYYRGNRYCGAYCYWEVNGKRYCTRRERDAHSQAPLLEDYGDVPVLK